MNSHSWSDRSARGRSKFARIGPLVVVSIVVWGAVLVGSMTSDGSGTLARAASPVALPPAVCGLPRMDATPAATPASVTPGVPIAAEHEVSVQIAGTIANLVACWRDSAWETSVALVTDRYLESQYGTRDPAVAVAALQQLTAAGLTAAVSLDSVSDVRSQGSGFASAEVTWREGKSLRRDRWRFVASGGRWLLDETESLAQDASGSAVGIEAIVEADRLRLSRERVVNPGTIVIHVRNLGTETTSLSAFRSLTTSQLRDRLAGALPSGGESPFVGEVVVAPGEEADLVLVDLAPDTYTVVAGLHGPGGTLQIRDAFSASLTVATP